MDFQKLKDEAKVGHISEEYVDFLKHRYITEILGFGHAAGANALWAYASFLNKLGHQPRQLPAVHQHAGQQQPLRHRRAAGRPRAGALPGLRGAQPVHREVDVRNFRRASRATRSTRNPCAYSSGSSTRSTPPPRKDTQLYPVSIAEVNSLGKFLDEIPGPGLAAQQRESSTSWARSRTWTCRTRQTSTSATSPRRPGRIRSDFFDHKRTLKQSITEVILEKARDPKFGTPPEHTYG